MTNPRIENLDSLFDHGRRINAAESMYAELVERRSRDSSVEAMANALDHIGGLSKALRVGGPADIDLEGLSAALREAVDMANETLNAYLQTETA